MASLFSSQTLDFVCNLELKTHTCCKEARQPFGDAEGRIQDMVDGLPLEQLHRLKWLRVAEEKYPRMNFPKHPQNISVWFLLK